MKLYILPSSWLLCENHIKGIIINARLNVYITRTYTCQLSRLQVENSDLTPAHAWLKNVSCCCLAWRNFQKFVYSDPFKERKPCSDVFRSLRTSSKDFGLLQESLEMIVSSSKISALPGYKSHAYILEKVGRYTLVTFYFEPFLTSRFPKQTYYVY